MGKGDRKTRKGKTFRGSFGNTRPHKKKSNGYVAPAKVEKEEKAPKAAAKPKKKAAPKKKPTTAKKKASTAKKKTTTSKAKKTASKKVKKTKDEEE